MRRAEAGGDMMMIDAFEPQGVTRLAVDSIFMMPQLGVLARCCRRWRWRFPAGLPGPLGTVIAPVVGSRR